MQNGTNSLLHAPGQWCQACLGGIGGNLWMKWIDVSACRLGFEWSLQNLSLASFACVLTFTLMILGADVRARQRDGRENKPPGRLRKGLFQALCIVHHLLQEFLTTFSCFASRTFLPYSWLAVKIQPRLALLAVCFWNWGSFWWTSSEIGFHCCCWLAHCRRVRHLERGDHPVVIPCTFMNTQVHY